MGTINAGLFVYLARGRKYNITGEVRGGYHKGLIWNMMLNMTFVLSVTKEITMFPIMNDEISLYCVTLNNGFRITLDAAASVIAEIIPIYLLI